MSELPTASVVIPTYNRVDYIATCLDHVQRQTVPPVEVIVVDASPDDATQRVVEGYPAVTYIRSPHGRGTTATSRSIGLERSTGQVVVYLDDDAYPAPSWLAELLRRYGPSDVAGVGGRTDNGRPHEELEGLDKIGKLLPNGQLTGNFAARSAGDVEVDHLLGANMSMRRDVIEELGGIRDFYPGTCLREESDIALRARAAGYRLIYTPEAVVRHVGGTYARGRRFDLRYEYFGARNHAVLLRTAVGPDDPRGRAARHAVAQVGQHLMYAGRSIVGHEGGGDSRIRGFANGTSRALVHAVGSAVGEVRARHYLRDLTALKDETPLRLK
ncbi:glycosyltransferase family 2 protein [uncultured Ornithinimicrobium sp.]|uniref:glycosyltransferase family 2 protein n=1 Tax=uncultured Ornithinimicrobium sp. TaxID=259307 RepID=UPI0025968238|nr:glycosyltransferase family 2 protein [uncultured Ornithinimicrobium sp.]